MKNCLLLYSLAFAQLPGLDLIFPAFTGRAGDAVVPFNPSGGFQPGKATYYGPNPVYPPGNEAGYRKSDVGVACSTGQDPRWDEILKRGVKVNPLDPETIWPTTPTVAVSEAAWGKSLCWKTLTIRSKLDPSKMITATVVDLCPASGCLWSKSERAHNVDLYGIDSFVKLGGDTKGGKLDLEIMWPAGYVPQNTAFSLRFMSSQLNLIGMILFSLLQT